MTFDYYNNVPFQNDYPSDDQTQMQVNCNSIAGIFDVDHIGFQLDGGPAVIDGGKHRLITFNEVTKLNVIAGQKSVVFTRNGDLRQVPLANFAKQTYVDNLSLIKAYVVFTAPIQPSTTVTILRSYNINSVTAKTAGAPNFKYEIVVEPVSVIDNTPLILPKIGMIANSSLEYTVQYGIGKTALTLKSVTASTLGTPNIITIILLQN